MEIGETHRKMMVKDSMQFLHERYLGCRHISFFKGQVQKRNSSGHRRKLGIFMNKARPVKLCNGSNESTGDR